MNARSAGADIAMPEVIAHVCALRKHYRHLHFDFCTEAAATARSELSANKAQFGMMKISIVPWCVRPHNFGSPQTTLPQRF